MLYKYKDIEDFVISGISQERIVQRIYNSETMKLLSLWASYVILSQKVENSQKKKQVKQSNINAAVKMKVNVKIGNSASKQQHHQQLVMKK